MIDLKTPISQLTKVGATTAKKLAKLGLKTASDLLYYYPFRYEDYRQFVLIKDLKDGQAVTVKARVELISNKRSWKKKRMFTEALVADDSGSLRVTWFNQPYIARLLRPGEMLYLSGKVKFDMLGAQLISPVYEKVTDGEATHTGRLVPIYPLTSGITEKQIRFLVSQALPLALTLAEWLPEAVLEKYDLAPLGASIAGVHFPHDEEELGKSLERLKFDELFLIQLQAARSRLSRQESEAPALIFKETEIKKFVDGLPFKLTATQKFAAWEILQDIAKPRPMNRLLSGDVGSGKTVVAAMALYSAVLNGYQGVLMAPTEILAVQHYNSINKILGDKVSIGLLTNSQYQISNIKYQNNDEIQNQKTKKQIVNKINEGRADIIVGTHALLSEGVEFKKLGLVIVDEQHRFGVEQRQLIKQKGQGVHFLSMTATPIPRSLALALYGDLDLSLIKELPPGRKKIITRLATPDKRAKAYEFIRAQVKQGRQVFVVCPLIEASEPSPSVPLPRGEGRPTTLSSRRGAGGEVLAFNVEKKSVMSEYEKLSKKIFPDLRVAYLHGKMKPKEKEEAMAKFSAQGGSASGGKVGETNILVSTSVIEVGVDIPNASIMMIEGAERFGLAQLHQFRGRVGRASHQSYCILFMEEESQKALDRLRFFETHHNGFELAEKDLEIRGPGEVYGTEQSGVKEMRLAKLTDIDLIKKARQAAGELAEQIYRYPALKNRLMDWESEVHWE